MKRKTSEHIRLDLIMLALTFGLQTLMELVLTVNSILSTDTLYMDTVFPDIATTAVSLLEILAMGGGLSIICVAFFMGKKKAPYILIYTAASLYRRIFAALVTLLIDTLSAADLFMSLSVFALDLAVLGIAVLIIHIFSAKYRRVYVSENGSSALFSDGGLKTDVRPIYPFKKLYGKGNPLQSALLSIGILLSAVKIASRTVGLIYVPPVNVLIPIVGYSSDLLIVILSYAISCFLLSYLYGQNEKRAAMRKLYEKN